MSGRFNDLIRIQSSLLLALSAAMALPFALALAYGEHTALVAFSEVMIGCALLGGAIRIFVKPVSRSLRLRDGFFVVTFSWLLCSFLGCLPFLLSGAIPSFADAFFESCSGFSTTGASVVADTEALPRSVLFWRSLTGWLGGLGIILILLPFLYDMPKKLCRIYFVFTFAEVLLLD